MSNNSRSTLPPNRRPGDDLPVGHHSLLGRRHDVSLESCRICFERVDRDELDECVGCGSARICSTCMIGHDCEGRALAVVQAMVRSGICIA